MRKRNALLWAAIAFAGVSPVLFGAEEAQAGYVEGHYETRMVRVVVVPGHYESRWVPPVIEIRYDAFGNPYRHIIRPGYYDRVWVPPVTRLVPRQFWVPGHWE